MDCAQKMRVIQSSSAGKNEKTEDPDYAETVELCMLNGPRSFRPWSRFVKFLVNFFICLTQFGFCCIYFVFIGDSLEQVCINFGIFLAKKLNLTSFILLFFIRCLSSIKTVFHSNMDWVLRWLLFYCRFCVYR